MANLRETPPVWFWVVAIVVTLWGMVGVFAFYTDAAMSDAVKAQLSEYDRNLRASQPTWFVWLYAVATISGLLGGIALLARSALARIFFVLSLVSVVLQFGWVFAATDLIAVKGFVVACAFPIFIAIVAAFQVWFAGLARKRAWIA